MINVKFYYFNDEIDSDQYGSYRIPCYNKDKVMECYIICDIILGDYKVFKGNYEI